MIRAFRSGVADANASVRTLYRQFRTDHVNNFVSVDFTILRELTEFGHKNVGRFYNSVFVSIPLMTDTGFPG